MALSQILLLTYLVT